MPIDHKSLRVKNLINYKGHPVEVYMVDDCSGDGSFYRINDLSINRETGMTVNGGENIFNPIPISSDILKASGWTKGDDRYGGYLSPMVNGEAIRLNKKESGEWFFQKSNYSNSIPILYVHLLQNLFYALFQEELNIIFK